jgi:ABC-2 type transport system permease protein
MLRLFLAELKRTWIEFIRYPIDAIAGVIITSLIFYGLFLSARYLAGPNLAFGDRLDAIVVGYILWSLVIFIVDDIAIKLQIEAQTGTLEQVLLSPFGTTRVFLARALSSLTLRLVVMLGILLFIIVLTGTHLRFPLSLVLPLSAVLLGAYGLAFMMGALALLFKRVVQLLGLFQFVLLFLLAVPTQTWVSSLQVFRLFLPMTLGADLLRDLMALNQNLELSQLALALLNGMGYFALGLLVFRWAEGKAKQQGIIGGY